MPRSDVTTSQPQPAVPEDDKDAILVRALEKLTRVASIYDLPIRSLCTNAAEHAIDVGVPTEKVLRLWASVLGVAATVNRVEHRDIGIIEHSVAANPASFDGWSVRFRHTHTIPTIPGDTTE